MAVVPTNTENEQKVSLPRRIATYITSMNFAKVFRRHHPRESSSPVPKPSERQTFIHHHRYPRPFSYHIPTTEQIPSSPSNLIPYRIGLSSDSTLLANGQTNVNDEIVRLPIKNGRGHSPKGRKDRRNQSQLNANKRWLFRSMEALDGWKEKVFSPKTRTANSSQSRSRSVENLADEDSREKLPMNRETLSIKQQQRAVSPNRSIESIKNRVINNISIHRKSTNTARSPALTINKQSGLTHLTNGHNNKTKQYNNNSSAILDFREISSLGFSHSKPRLSDGNETISLTPSENVTNDDDNEETTSNISFLPNDYNPNEDDGETADSWDFSITWIDSLKEQHSPQRKIQFYENLIKLLEQDTLNIDELLVLRKVLAKIWPIDESTTNYGNQTLSSDSKTNGSKSLRTPNRIKRRSKLPTMTHHTAQRCSAIIEPSPLIYETLHEQTSGHNGKPSSLLIPAKAKSYISNPEQNYPLHLNPFGDEIADIKPSAPPVEPNNSDSIRRYFERLTLLETIYEKLNIESNKTPDHHEKFVPQENYPISHSINKSDTIKPLNKFLEMNVDGNGSLSSGKSSLKRRAPTAPHVSQKEHNRNPSMFTLSSTDLNAPHKSEQPMIRSTSHDERLQNKISPKERTPPSHNSAAACDDDGHIFVYDPTPNQITEEQSVTSPRKSERIQQWLSSCSTKEESKNPNHPLPLLQNTSPSTQIKMRCISKTVRPPSCSPQHYQEKNPSPPKTEIEPGRFRSCLKINLEPNEPSNHRSRASSSTSRYHQRQQTILDDTLNITNDYFEQNRLSPNYQAVFL